jgi:hypothetical protein
MPSVQYWAALAILTAVVLIVRALNRAPLSERVLRLGRLDISLVVVSLLALGFHCATMFFPPVFAELPQLGGAATSIRELGAASQLAYWLPAGLLAFALRRAWTPLLVAEASVLLAVGVTMFWSVALTWHLVAIASSVAVTLAVLATATSRPAVR